MAGGILMQQQAARTSNKRKSPHPAARCSKSLY
jgi:hypothetical protein